MLFYIVGFIISSIIGLAGTFCLSYELIRDFKMSESEFRKRQSEKNTRSTHGINKTIIQSGATLIAAAWFADRLFH